MPPMPATVVLAGVVGPLVAAAVELGLMSVPPVLQAVELVTEVNTAGGISGGNGDNKEAGGGGSANNNELVVAVADTPVVVVQPTTVPVLVRVVPTMPVLIKTTLLETIRAMVM